MIMMTIEVAMDDKFYSIPISDKRFILIWGINGSGKTRLLETIEKRYGDKVIYFDCKMTPYLTHAWLERLFLDAGEKNRTKFLEALNSDFLHFKKLNDDCTFTHEKSGTVLRFEQLSHGEKNIVSIFAMGILSKYDLVCFDDIEFSIDCTIQSKLMTKLYEKTDKFYVVATHSPQVISEHMEDASSQIQKLVVSEFKPDGVEWRPSSTFPEDDV